MRHTSSYVKAMVKNGRASRLEEARRTRDALVAAATELFVEEGLSGPSLDAICAHAGFTRGAFYVHFANRDELIAAVVESATASFLDAMLASGAHDLEAIVRTFAAAVRSGAFPFAGKVRGHQMMEACLRAPALRLKYIGLLAHAEGRLADIVRAGQEAGSVRGDVDPAALTQLLLALVLGAQTATELGVPYDVDRAAEDLLRMLAPG